ncbi:Hsp70 family protein [Corynebacterium sp. 335C]
MTGTWHLAVDFGTSNTAAAHTTPDGAEALALTHEGHLMPSAVFAGDDGIHAGPAAVNMGASRPDAFLASPKRMIDHATVPLGGRDVEVADLVAAVLRRVIDVGARRHGGAAPATLTLTHPEAWPATALATLREAAARAGVDPAATALVSEPRAAALHHAAGHGVPDGGHVAVFDFGGGTLDVAVLEARGGGAFDVVAARGDNSLGGRNVDAALRAHVLRELEDEDPEAARFAASASPAAQLAFDQSVRRAKEILSDSTSATVAVVTPDGPRGVDVTRAELEELLADDVARAADLVRAALRDAGADPASTPLFLVGGSSLIPLVREVLDDVSRVTTLDDPKTVVARGALAEAARAAAAGEVGGSAGGGAGAGGAGGADAAADPDNPFASLTGAAAGAGGAGGADAAADPDNPFASLTGAAGAAGASGADADATAGAADDAANPFASLMGGAAAPATRDGDDAETAAQAGEDPSSRARRRRLITVSVIAAVVAVGGGIAAWTMASGGGEETQAEAAPASRVDGLPPAVADVLPEELVAKTGRCLPAAGGYTCDFSDHIAAQTDYAMFHYRILDDPAQMTETPEGDVVRESGPRVVIKEASNATITVDWDEGTRVRLEAESNVRSQADKFVDDMGLR